MSVSSSDFRAYIDLADYYPATGTVPVYVEVLNNKDYLVDAVTAKACGSPDKDGADPG